MIAVVIWVLCLLLLAVGLLVLAAGAGVTFSQLWENDRFRGPGLVFVVIGLALVFLAVYWMPFIITVTYE